jgi:hypothetical protein
MNLFAQWLICVGLLSPFLVLQAWTVPSRAPSGFFAQ